MRHANFGRKLSRDTKARKALLAGVATSLIEHGKITTTLAKAKFAQSYVEKLITSAQKNQLSTNHRLASKLTKKAFLKLTDEIGPGFEERKGGYTRVIKVSPRSGDAAKMARIDLLEWDKTRSKVKSQNKESRNIKAAKVKPKLKKSSTSAKRTTNTKSNAKDTKPRL